MSRSRLNLFWLLVVGAVAALQSSLGLEWPSWLRGICIALVLALGAAILIKPRIASNMRPAITRATGAFLVLVAALTYFQFKPFASE